MAPHNLEKNQVPSSAHAPAAPLTGTSEVWVIRYTGELFTEYQ